MAEGWDQDDPVVDGIVRFGELTGDSQAAKAAGVMYSTVRGPFRAVARPDHRCVVAFPSMIILPDSRRQCFVAVYEDEAIVAWERGAFRKRVEHVALALRDVTSVRWAVSQTGATRGATLLHVDGPQPLVLALYKGKREAADAIRDAFRPPAAAG